MNKTKTYIELNGATYDATTGRFVKHVADRPVSVPAMDGVVRRPSVKPAAEAPAVAHPKRTRHQAARSVKRKTQRSQTLMRQAVRRPTISNLLHAKTAPLAIGNSTVAVAGRAASINPARVQRAQAVSKSGLVSKFGGAGKVVMRMAHLPVTEPPRRHAVKHSHQSAEPTAFTKALDQARSHEQPKIRKPRAHHRLARKLHLTPTMLNVSAAAVAAVLIGGFILYQNVPNLTVRLAAARAGFHASLPSYHPAGFTIKGPVKYAAGELTINFQSNTDSRSFQVKQQASNWNSETLLEAYVAKQNQPYQTYEDSGRTVYIDNDSANLVTGNKWVQVKSDGSLSAEQLLNIVKGIN